MHPLLQTDTAQLDLPEQEGLAASQFAAPEEAPDSEVVPVGQLILQVGGEVDVSRVS